MRGADFCKYLIFGVCVVSYGKRFRRLIEGGKFCVEISVVTIVIFYFCEWFLSWSVL